MRLGIKNFSKFFANCPSLEDIKVMKAESEEEDEENTNVQEKWCYLRSVALLLQGKIHLLKKEYDTGFELYCQVVEIEEKMGINVSGWLSYSEFVVRFGKTELYDVAERYLYNNYDTKDFDFDIITNRLLAKIAENKQDVDRQKYYSDIANGMLKDAAKEFKPLYYNVVKITNLENNFMENIELFLKSKNFTRENDTNSFGWVRNGFACKQHLILIPLFDVVVIKAYIYFIDVVTGQPQAMGLDGFIAIVSKLPLKKIVKQLEKIITIK